MEFPVKKKWNSLGCKNVIIFDDYYSGTNESGNKVSLTIPCTDFRWVDVEDEEIGKRGIYDNEVLESYKKNGTFAHAIKEERETDHRGDGGTTSYYQLPENAKELGDLIYHKEMNHSIGEAFCAIYRLNDNGEYARNIRKAIFYLQLELKHYGEPE